MKRLHHMLRAAAGYVAPTPPSTDPQFNYVTMLLHGDGTNGAQNNTFVDSSTNNFTITRNGTPTQGSFSPYGDLWSIFSPSSSDLLSGTGNVQFTGNFTIEAWVFITSASGRDVFKIGSEASGRISFGVDSLNRLFSNAYGTSSILYGGASVSLNTWTHVAWVRNGTTVTGYANGVAQGTQTISGNVGNTSGFSVGQGPMYTSNARFVNGAALYTSAFTPSTTPLTAVSGTSLLTCQSNRFRDNSSNNFAITVTGTPSVQRFSPFDPAAEYSTSVIGGSGYLNGSQSLSAPAGTAFNFGTGDFTAECWCYSISRSAMMRLFAQTGFSVSNVSILFEIATTGVATAYVSTGSTYVSATGTATVALNAWTHVAMVRNVNTLRLYVNGVQSGTASLTGVTVPSPTSPFVVGCNGDYNANFFPGYISEMRVVKGTCLYPSGTTFTPPTAPLTAVTNTSLLLNTVNAGIFDNAMMNDLVTVGDAQISTAVVKYGTGSMKFDGTGDYLTATNTPNLQFGTGDFTIEAWVYMTTVSYECGIVSKGAATTGWSFGVNASATNRLFLLYGTSNLLFTSGIPQNAWTHVALTRSGSTIRAFINGVQDATTGTIATSIDDTSILRVGEVKSGTRPLNGYIDDLRITKGIARYTSTFTPPTAAFPNL